MHVGKPMIYALYTCISYFIATFHLYFRGIVFCFHYYLVPASLRLTQYER